MKAAANEPIRVASEKELQKRLAGGPAVFLSASVPYERTRPKQMTQREWMPRAKLNREYLASAEPARIRSAVIATTRALLARGLRLVFGAHPAISPMVLGAARDMGAPARSVIIFQSEYFRDEFPRSTLSLASWEAGVLVLTAVVPGKNGLDHESREASLVLMRQLMVAVPNLCGAVFVGGMEGVQDEAALFREKHPRARVYAIASTGSAARALWRQQPSAFSGQLSEPGILEKHPSYSVVAREIFADLKIAGGPGVPRSLRKGVRPR